MKKLISAQMVKEARQAGEKEIYAPISQTIVTPEARSVAEKLGIRILDTIKQQKMEKAGSTDEETVRIIVQSVMEKLPPGKYTEDEVRKVVLDVLAKR
jgi:ethanolamine utilization protein EutQ